MLKLQAEATHYIYLPQSVIHKRGSIDNTTSQSYTKIISIQYHATTITIPKPFHNHNHPHTLYSREDHRPLVTVSLAIMIVVHFAKVRAMYP
jgi:hypothetical protein